ncbi:LPS export ABC transporter periplasmic protein LptC [Acuticoccus sp. I52.16.1]|uniref:LPS export ABC transporter periplasmic protein LptC n=1 Tax=Acuticoccus sp. I52.16.1 TaxID=2928472 RepID=UPI001FD050CF|nr:LPS export ABC transporter periplasmic protein LptC [Acuticoccus sp. I52.16.1]UOM35653.1 LPS export ABC transporter periplasmic protein LptC [Acuticoccus sp. I52.16.1]
MTDAAALPLPGDGSFAPRTRRREEQRALRNTRRVKRLRVLVPTLGMMIAAVITVAAVLPKLFPIAALAGLSLTADGLVMNEPKLAGHLGGGRRYEVVASRAIQSLLTPSHLAIEGLDAKLEMSDGERVAMHSDEATYDTNTEVLTLDDGIRIDSTDGTQASMDRATVLFQKGEMHSEAGVSINSPRGTIRAGRIDVFDGGDLIRFSDGVAITIHPAT